MMATTTAMPAAAETKFWTVRPIIWDRSLLDTSPLYACQFVLVTKLTAVFQATAGATASTPVGFAAGDPGAGAGRTARSPRPR